MFFSVCRNSIDFFCIHKCRKPWAVTDWNILAGAQTRKSPSSSIHLFMSTNLFEPGAAVFVLYVYLRPSCECAAVESTVL